MHVEHKRVDGSVEPTRLEIAHYGVVERIDATFGFSMAGTVTTADESLTVVTPSTCPTSGSVWDGASPAAGQLWVYGPGSTQASFLAPGSGSHILSVPWASLERAASANQIELPGWQRRRARLTGPRVGRLVEVLSHGFDALDHGADEIELARTVVQALAAGPSRGLAQDRRSSSREVTVHALDWIEADGRWFPSLAEVCATVGVSERRLRYAFVDVFQVPPGRYLRLRALNAVRAALLDPASLHRSITDITIDHGFRHLSLFTKHYRHTFGETPTATRRQTPRWGRSAGHAFAPS